MPSHLVDLRPNRHLLDHDFEGYKLNLQALPHHTFDLVTPVDKLVPDEAQYSFIHAKLFALHNHLVLDFWDFSLNYYYIDNERVVRRISFESTTRTYTENVVYHIPTTIERKSGHFNMSLSFPSSSLALLSDGAGNLYIIDTGPRNRPAGRNQHWATLHNRRVLEEGEYFVILDARANETRNIETLHCLLQSVEQNELSFNSVLTWVTFESFDLNWKQTSLRQLKGKGIVHYAAIETSCDAIYLATDNTFNFTLDTVRTISPPKDKKKKKIYTWQQTEDEITISMKLKATCDHQLLNVEVTINTIEVVYDQKTFICGNFTNKVDSELTTWNVNNIGLVEILIIKSEKKNWEDLLEGGDCNGEQVFDVAYVNRTHNKLAHLCSETEVAVDQGPPGYSTQGLEECDAASDEDTVLARFSAISHNATHRVPLSVHQYLFSIRVETQEVPALALRHDVDACIWQPFSKQPNNAKWALKHQGTLMAFGYVQSSKQNRKFVTCPPNFSYSVVCESTKHIFIYRNGIDENSQLRKRTGGVMRPIRVGQQHVFNIEQFGEVIGISATNEILFILTQTKMVAIEIQ